MNSSSSSSSPAPARTRIGTFLGHLEMHPQAQQFRLRTYFPMTQQVPFLQVQPPQMQMYHPMMPNHNETVYYQYQWLPQPLPPLTVPLQSPTPTRSLLLYKVPTYVSETIVRTELQVFGEVKSVGMERLQDGIVTVHFYDLRHSAAALAAIQNHYIQHQHIMRLYYTVLTLPPLAHRVVAGSATWAQFYVPSISADDSNQGILVVRNLDREISSSRILEIFESFGAVKELREAPLGSHQWFVEFFDIRDAADALSGLDGKEFAGGI